MSDYLLLLEEEMADPTLSDEQRQSAYDQLIEELADDRPLILTVAPFSCNGTPDMPHADFWI